MPVLPLVGSRSSRPGSNSPAASAVSIIALAMRSLIEPVGFCPSSFAKIRTSPTGFNSTSGVSPTRSSTDAAIVLRIAPPDVDRRAELAKELIDTPARSGDIRVDVSRSVTFEQFLLASLQPGKAEQVAARVPRSVFDHALTPLAPERDGRLESQARRLRT